MIKNEENAYMMPKQEMTAALATQSPKDMRDIKERDEKSSQEFIGTNIGLPYNLDLSSKASMDVSFELGILKKERSEKFPVILYGLGESYYISLLQ